MSIFSGWPPRCAIALSPSRSRYGGARSRRRAGFWRLELSGEAGLVTTAFMKELVSCFWIFGQLFFRWKSFYFAPGKWRPPLFSGHRLSIVNGVLGQCETAGLMQTECGVEIVGRRFHSSQSILAILLISHKSKFLPCMHCG